MLVSNLHSSILDLKASNSYPPRHSRVQPRQLGYRGVARQHVQECRQPSVSLLVRQRLQVRVRPQPSSAHGNVKVTFHASRLQVQVRHQPSRARQRESDLQAPFVHGRDCHRSRVVAHRESSSPRQKKKNLEIRSTTTRVTPRGDNGDSVARGRAAMVYGQPRRMHVQPRRTDTQRSSPWKVAHAQVHWPGGPGHTTELLALYDLVWQGGTTGVASSPLDHLHYYLGGTNRLGGPGLVTELLALYGLEW